MYRNHLFWTEIKKKKKLSVHDSVNSGSGAWQTHLPTTLTKYERYATPLISLINRYMTDILHDTTPFLNISYRNQILHPLVYLSS